MDELDVKKMIEKIRMSQDILSNIVSKQYLQLLKFSHSTVIDINDGDEKFINADDLMETVMNGSNEQEDEQSQPMNKVF